MFEWAKIMKKVLFLGLALVAAAVWAWIAYEPTETLQYKTVTVERGEVVRSVSVVGTLHPNQKVDVGAQVSGQVVEVLVDFNDAVKTGQVLARLNPKQFEARIKQAEADLAIAVANLASSKASLQEAEVGKKDIERQIARARDLFPKRLISQSELDAVELKLEQQAALLQNRSAQVEVSKAAIRQREAALSDARTNLEYTVIRSPADGIVIQRNVNVGQTLASNFQTPVLFVIAESLEGMQLEASVDEADIGLVKKAQSVRFTVDAFPDQNFDGEVKTVRLVPTQVQNVVTYTVVIHVDNRRQQLLPGLTANATIEIARETDTLRVPNMALRFTPPSNDNDVTPAATQGGSPGGGPGQGGGMVDRLAERLKLDEQQKTSLQNQVRGAFSSPGGRERVAEVFRKFRAELNDEQAKRFDEWMAERGSGSGARKRLWTLDDKGELRAVTVRTGASDERFTAIRSEELKEGMPVVTGIEKGAP